MSYFIVRIRGELTDERLGALSGADIDRMGGSVFRVEAEDKANAREKVQAVLDADPFGEIVELRPADAR